MSSAPSSQHNDVEYYYAQVYNPITENLIRVQFQKGDKVSDLIEVVFNKWGISYIQGWLPIVAYGGHSFQLRLTDEIPTDINKFFEEHFHEFAYNPHDAKEKGIKNYRGYGDIIEPRGRLGRDFQFGRPMKGKKWNNNDIRIMIVAFITGG